MTLLWWAVPLAIVVFLLTLNGFLYGAWKAHIDAVLGMLMVGLLVVAFAASGWRVGLAAIGGMIVFGAVTHPFAAGLAGRLLDRRD